MRYALRILSLAALGVLQAACSRSGTPAPEPAAELSPESGSAQRATPQRPIEEDTFYNDLEPYGDWVELPDYGWSFSPTVDSDWRPYTRGQWENTDAGWYWDSDEDFGWATYHYGRWVDDRQYGWVWIPGDEWAPAWVSWRQGSGYTGWAPLPPRAVWRTNVGLQIGGLELDAYIGASDYNFVEDRYFVDHGIYQRVQPWALNVDILSRTTNVTRYEAANNRVYDRGVGVVDIERAIGRNVPQRRTVDGDRRAKRGRDQTGDVSVFRPTVKIVSGKRPSRGHSLVKGEPPPEALVERNRRRERPGRDGEVSAGVAAKQERGAAKRDRGQPDTPAPLARQPQVEKERQRRETTPPPVDSRAQDRVARERGDQEQRDRAQAEAARQKKPDKSHGRADSPPKQDEGDKKGAPKDKKNPKSPRQKPTPHG